MTIRRPLSTRRAREIIVGADLVKAPDWPNTRTWHVVSGGQVLVVITPSYGGTSHTGRNGWRWRLADLGPCAGGRPEPTREQAATTGLGAWQRWATSKETP